MLSISLPERAETTGPPRSPPGCNSAIKPYGLPIAIATWPTRSFFDSPAWPKPIWERKCATPPGPFPGLPEERHIRPASVRENNLNLIRPWIHGYWSTPGTSPLMIIPNRFPRPPQTCRNADKRRPSSSRPTGLTWLSHPTDRLGVGDPATGRQHAPAQRRDGAVEFLLCVEGGARALGFCSMPGKSHYLHLANGGD